MRVQISDIEKDLFYKVMGFGSLDSGLKKIKFEDDIYWKIEKVKWVLQLMPFVRQIGVCNSHAFGMADEESDIDLLIVCNEKRLYLARLFGVFLFQVMGLRRYKDKIRGRFCLSFWIDENNLNMSDLMIDKDYYLHLWRERVWWLMNDDEIIDDWLKKNDLKFGQRLSSYEKFSVAKAFEFLFGGRFGDFWEFVLGCVQRLVAHKKYVRKNFPKGVVFEEGIVKCHDEDKRWEIRSKIEKLKTNH